jgi:hypothetical protein
MLRTRNWLSFSLSPKALKRTAGVSTLMGSLLPQIGQNSSSLERIRNIDTPAQPEDVFCVADTTNF